MYQYNFVIFIITQKRQKKNYHIFAFLMYSENTTSLYTSTTMLDKQTLRFKFTFQMVDE